MVRRILFASFWFVIFALALLVAGGGIAGAMAGGPPPTAGESFVTGYNRGYDAGIVAGAEFRERYGLVVLGVAGILAAAGSISGILPGTRR